MNINEYFRKNVEKTKLRYNVYQICPRVECADGFVMSVQASHTHYCKPRESELDYYLQFEVGFPSEKEDLLMDYVEDEDNPTETVYGYVPFEVIDAVIKKHGGFKCSND